MEGGSSTKPIRLEVGQLPETAGEWISLYRSGHRLHNASHIALQRLHRALSEDPRPRTSKHALAVELGVASSTAYRLLQRLAALGAIEAERKEVEVLRTVWPPRRS